MELWGYDTASLALGPHGAKEGGGELSKTLATTILMFLHGQGQHLHPKGV